MTLGEIASASDVKDTMILYIVLLFAALLGGNKGRRR